MRIETETSVYDLTTVGAPGWKNSLKLEKILIKTGKVSEKPVGIVRFGDKLVITSDKMELFSADFPEPILTTTAPKLVKSKSLMDLISRKP